MVIPTETSCEISWHYQFDYVQVIRKRIKSLRKETIRTSIDNSLKPFLWNKTKRNIPIGSISRSGFQAHTRRWKKGEEEGS